jgi:uncharacterized protein (TIGR03118 family)
MIGALGLLGAMVVSPISLLRRVPPAFGVVTSAYQQTNLVSDQPGVAANTDPKLVNPWGISSSSTSPFWVSDAGTGLSTLYNSAGVPSSIVVTIPGGAGLVGPSTPTGNIFNGTRDFVITKGTASAVPNFIFATEDGTLSAWSPTVDARNAVLTMDNSKTGAVFKGLAMANNGSGNFLYAADFGKGTIDVFDGKYAAQPAAAFPFTDPNLPAGFAPFNVQTFGGNLYVAYAKQDSNKLDDVGGSGNGFVNIFTPNGQLIRRLVTQGPLNSPWGMAIAPAGFGQFSGALLVGNFRDGRITAFDPTTGALLGQLSDATGAPISIHGLWGLWFGNGGNGGVTTKLYFAAGPDNETHGLFGSLTPGGYWLVGRDGGVFAYGAATFFGSMGGQALNSPVVAISSTVDGLGYWLTAADGGIFAYGDARFFGGMGGKQLTAPITAMTPTPDGKGYWLLGADGGVFAFGTAPFLGGMAGVPNLGRFVGIAATPDGKGYWLATADGGIFPFGSATPVNGVGRTLGGTSVVGIAAAPSGLGLWAATADGGVAALGTAGTFGDVSGVRLAAPVVGLASSVGGAGYWLGARDGGVFALGRGVPFVGSAGTLKLNAPVVGVAAMS